MKYLQYFLFWVVLQFLAMNSAMATLLSVDYKTAGDGLLTLDTSTGLEWLDLAASLNYSYNDMQTALGTGGVFDGFHYARAADVDQLQLSAGLPSGLFTTTSSYYQTRVSALMNLVGITLVSGSNLYSYGLTGDPFTSTTTIDDRVLRGFSLTLGASALQGVVADSSASTSIGSWLIRKAPTVAEPGSLLLLGTGLLGLALVSRRRSLCSVVS